VTRKRRSPEEARAHILAAATRLLAAHGPDAVGLKEVAREAGVSHALVSHYFGTYERLVEEALAAHMRASRADLLARMTASAEDDVGAWIEHLLRTTSDPVYARMVAWGTLSGRLESDDFFPRKEQGLRTIVDALSARFRARGVEVDRREVELALVVVLTSALGYAIVGKALWGALGHAADDTEYRRKLTELAHKEIEAIVRRARR
jgi:AcrR family transcriptional regulator